MTRSMAARAMTRSRAAQTSMHSPATAATIRLRVAGLDTASYTDSLEGVTVDLAAGEVLGRDALGDTFTGIGSAHADRLTGSAARHSTAVSAATC
jgi:hypothetical protein